MLLVSSALAAWPGPCTEQVYSSGHLLWTWAYRYDNGRLVERAIPGPPRLSMTYAYDAKGRLATVTSPGDGTVDTYRYQGGLLTSVVTGSVQHPDVAFNVRTYTYADGRLVQMEEDRRTKGAPNRRVSYVYDDLGRVAQEIEVPVWEPGSIWEHVADSNRVVTTTFTYDADGNRLTSDGGATHLTYDYACWTPAPGR